jgi:hypothetical protein
VASSRVNSTLVFFIPTSKNAFIIRFKSKFTRKFCMTFPRH